MAPDSRMSKAEIKEAVFRAIRDVAPEAELESILPDRPVRDQIEMDSMDQLNVMIRIHKTLGIDIPESDYPRLDTLDRIVDYLALRLEQRRSA